MSAAASLMDLDAPEHVSRVEALQTLKIMFSGVPETIISRTLAATSGNMEETISALLDMSARKAEVTRRMSVDPQWKPPAPGSPPPKRSREEKKLAQQDLKTTKTVVGLHAGESIDGLRDAAKKLTAELAKSNQSKTAEEARAQAAEARIVELQAKLALAEAETEKSVQQVDEALAKAAASKAEAQDLTAQKEALERTQRETEQRLSADLSQANAKLEVLEGELQSALQTVKSEASSVSESEARAEELQSELKTLHTVLVTTTAAFDSQKQWGNDLNSQLSATQEQLDRANAELRELSELKGAVDSQVLQQQAQLAELNGRSPSYAELQRELGESRADVTRLQGELAAARDAVGAAEKETEHVQSQLDSMLEQQRQQQKQQEAEEATADDEQAGAGAAIHTMSRSILKKFPKLGESYLAALSQAKTKERRRSVLPKSVKALATKTRPGLPTEWMEEEAAAGVNVDESATS